MSGRPLVVLAYGRNFPYPYDAQTPLPLFSLGAALTGRGFEVELYDERLDPPRAFRELLLRRPLAVGFSVMGGYQIEASRRLGRRVRELSPESKIVWGGFFPGVLPREALELCGADFAVTGEAELVLSELCEGLAAGRADFSGLRGLAWRAAGRPVVNAPAGPPDLEALPSLFYPEALPLLRRYIARGGVRETVGYEASRGCGHGCAFCYSRAFHGAVRVKSAVKLERELTLLRGLGAASLDICDDLLMGGSQEGITALAGLLKKLDFSWSANLRVELLTPALLKTLEGAGCKWLYFGLESEDDRTLRDLGKGFNRAQLRRGLELLRGSGINPVFSLITGLPSQRTGAEVMRPLDLAEELHRLHPRAEIQVQSFVPLPGAPLYPDALRLGFRPPSTPQGWRDHDHFSVCLPWLDAPALPRKLYLSSFLAYRYGRHLSGFPASLVFLPLRLLSLWRIRHRCFALYFERALYAAAAGACRLWRALSGARL